MSKDLDGEISVLLKSVVDHFGKEDLPTRERQIRHWRKLKLYWNNFSQIYWAEDVGDYRIYNGSDSGSDDQSYYDRPVNVFKSFLETIIAALSIQIPAVSCIPGDADNPLDLSTAKAGNIIGEQIYKHNDVIFLWLHALYIYCTEGMIACYVYNKEDESYGTYEKKHYKDEEIETHQCPSCGIELDEQLFLQAQQIKDTQSDKVDPDDDDAELDDEYENKDEVVCPECAAALDPNLQKTKLTVQRLDKITNEAKSRTCLEVYGGLYVKVANYAKQQCDTPYLDFAYETHYANVLEEYPNLRDKGILPKGGGSANGVNDPYEQYGRVNTQYRNDYPENNVTVSNWWLRPAAFNVLDKEEYNKLKRKFPDGCKTVFVNDVCADYENESLDDHWTLTRNPTSDYLTHEPLGEVLTSIQDIVNDLISLTLQTIEHGIAQTWVDPSVVNIPAQGQVECQPGTLTAVKSQGGGKNIGDAFFTSQTASLSPEIFNFYRIVQELGQFVSGALPSLFGGQQANSSQTASEYAMSKSSAMQRLQTPWKMLSIWWKTIFGKAIPLYMKSMVEDEKLVKKDDQGNFINVFIRKSEMGGSIGEYELETSEQLPITDEQQAEVIMKLMGLNNQEIMTSLLSPDNIPFIRKVVRIPQFKLPGEDDRQKQYEEINELINSEPIVTPPEGPEVEEMQMLAEQGDEAAAMTLQQLPPTELPSVEVDPDVDNHQIEADICRGWLISEAGRLAKKENPAGYKNVLLHMKAHIMIIQQQMMQQMMSQVGNEEETETNSGGKAPGKKEKQPEKIRKESDVRTPVS